MTTISNEYARFVLSLDLKRVPVAVLEKAKGCILDTLGVAIYGADTPWVKSVLGFVDGLGGPGEASLWAQGSRTTAMGAALVNGTMAASYDYDDTAASTHPSGIIVPTALAVGEWLDRSGVDVLGAAVAGYEVLLRVAEAANPFPAKGVNRRGFHPTSVVGIFGAVATAGKLLSLTEAQMANAFGIAGSHASGLLEWLADGAWTKRYHPGKAAWEGIMACRLAKSGFIGPATVFEGRNGVLHAYSDDTDPSRLLDGLGKDWRTVTRIRTKFYPSGHDTHSPIQATLDLVKEHDIRPEQVSEVVVKGATTSITDYCQPLEQKQAPQTLLEAQINIPFAMAIAIVKRRFTLETLTDEGLRDPLTREVVKKIRPQNWALYDADQTRYEHAAIVDIILKDGQILSKEIVYPKGSPANPAKPEELETKFRDCTSRFLSEARASQVIRMVKRLEEVPRVRRLGAVVRGTS